MPFLTLVNCYSVGTKTMLTLINKHLAGTKTMLTLISKYLVAPSTRSGSARSADARAHGRRSREN